MPGVPDTGPARESGQGDELHELRELLLGQEIVILADLESRVSDPAKRTADVAEVLPSAIRSGKKPLREALEPVVERSLQSAVRRNPKEIADAIYPVMGPAIRSSIAAAIRDFAETLNQIVEKSASLSAIRWRIESLITGKPFSEILLARSLLYSVQQVFLIHRPSGLLLQHVAATGAVVKDADMVSGMLTAIQDFLADSFAEGREELETVDAGRFKLWLSYSPKLLLVGAVSGAAPVELKQVFRKALDGIDGTLSAEIGAFKQGDTGVFEPARPFLEKCLLGKSDPGKTKKARLWPYLAVVGVIAIAIAGYTGWQRMRWNQFIEALRHEPGIVVTSVDRSGSKYTIRLLRDPDAPDPAALLAARHLDPAKVRFEWTPYESLNTPFAVKRDLNAAKLAIENRIVRFDSGSSKLGASEADRIDDITVSVRQLLKIQPAARITITGRADEIGDGKTNEKLGQDRANVVANAFRAQGIPESAIAVVSVGNHQPLRPGVSEWDRAANRSVSFSVSADAAK
ncbi:MAG TPA: OmpA family protein [Bryobacteraceae bacterium]|nr:OmpA family protein [Bryobacteraceae bacterium]